MKSRMEVYVAIFVIGIILISGCIGNSNTPKVGQSIDKSKLENKAPSVAAYAVDPNKTVVEGVYAKGMNVTLRPPGVVSYEEKTVYVTRIPLYEEGNTQYDVISTIFVINKTDLPNVGLVVDNNLIVDNFQVEARDNKNLLLADVYVPIAINRTFISTDIGADAHDKAVRYQPLEFIESMRVVLREDPAGINNNFYRIAVSFTIGNKKA